jgi:very-short-patch-repair endonuclease
MSNERSKGWKKRWTAVAAIAARQWGCITTAHLVSCGVTPPVISRWVAEGRLYRLLRGVYAAGHISPAPEQRWQAALLSYGKDAVLSRYVSIALHGLGKPPSVTTVAVPRAVRAQRGVKPHFSSMPFERDEVVIRKGLRTTSIERTLLDLAAIGEPVERLVAEAVAKRLTSIAKLRAYVERRAGARGARRLSSCIEGRQTRSKLEDEFVRWLEDRRLPVPSLNEPFGPFTLDGFWHEARLVLEIDDFETHGTAEPFEGDRRRDTYTASRGLRTIRATPQRWRHDGDRLERDIRRALTFVEQTFQQVEGS